MDLKAKAEEIAGKDTIAVIAALAFAATALQGIQAFAALGIPVRVTAGIGGFLLVLYVWGVSKRIARIEARHAAPAPLPPPASAAEPDEEVAAESRKTLVGMREALTSVQSLLDDPPEGMQRTHPRCSSWIESCESVRRFVDLLSKRVPLDVGVRMKTPHGFPKRKAISGHEDLVSAHVVAGRLEMGLLQSIEQFAPIVEKLEQEVTKRRAAELLKRRALRPRV